MKRSIRPLTFAWVLVAACATAAPSRSSDPSTEVEVEVEKELTPKEVFTRMVHAHVAARRPAVEQCYLSEVLSGPSARLADFDLTVRARPRSRQPIVRVVKASQPGQQLLASCVKTALSAVPFRWERFDVFVVPVHVAAPEWLATL